MYSKKEFSNKYSNFSSLKLLIILLKLNLQCFSFFQAGKKWEVAKYSSAAVARH